MDDDDYDDDDDDIYKEIVNKFMMYGDVVKDH
jgi:hypothetical protein